MFRIRISSLLCAAVLFLASCGGGDDGTNGYDVNPTTGAGYTYTYPGSGYGIEHLSTPQTDTGDSSFVYSIDLGSAVKDVFFVFTNVSQTDATDPPKTADMAIPSPAQLMSSARTRAASLNAMAAQKGIGLKDRPDIALFNSDPERFIPPATTSLLSADMAIAPPAPVLDTVGATTTFYPEGNTTTIVNATCRQVVSDSSNSKTLNIWVDDNAWGSGCPEANCVTQTMVDEIAAKFLTDGTDNDIYDWVTNIYGAEWGAHGYTNLISTATTNNNLTILLFDIMDDNATNGGILGYFWAKDNYTSAAVAYSNERLMFYIDSNLFAEKDGVSWEITDYWPDIMVGTLAHEFQHMIHFYQKNVLNNTTSPTWLNEMSSEMAEDFVATKLGIDGPRGVAYTDGSAGSSGNIYGRLPRFNDFDYIAVTDWMSGDINDPGDSNVLNSYSLNYAFGAYLARNFSGASLFQNMVQNSKSDHTAIDDALAATGYSGETFASVLQKWGVATLLSDDATAAVPAGYRYNTGSFIDTTMNATTYNLGSIDLTNYTSGSQVGPKVYTSLPPSDAMAGKYKASNMYYLVGSGLTGKVSRFVTLRKGTKLSVVVR